jgi:ADP-ribose pyrophosphatase
MNHDEDLIETQVSTEVLAKGRLLDARRDIVRLPSGETSVREYVMHPGAVVIIAELDNGNLLFERQFRYPVGRVFLELPAGKIDPGEDIAETARRELLEETGHVAGSWRYLGVMHPCIGYSNERIEIFLAQQVSCVAKPTLDAEEFLQVLELSLDAAIEAVRRGEITDAKTITALFWAEKSLRSGW